MKHLSARYCYIVVFESEKRNFRKILSFCDKKSFQEIVDIVLSNFSKIDNVLSIDYYCEASFFEKKFQQKGEGIEK